MRLMLSDELKKQLLSKEDPFPDIIGQDDAKQATKSALLLKRHVIIVGPPGIGKTTLAKNVARLLPDIEVSGDELFGTGTEKAAEKKGGKRKLKGISRFVRIQGSPDLTTEDLLGDIDPIKALKHGPLSLEAFTPGKIFKAHKGVLFFDELNRCPEKLQNSLLQVLEERKATLGTYDIDIKADFIFIGTMNPDDSSTEKLSDVFLDRFDLLYMGYPEDISHERKIVLSKGSDMGIAYPDNLLTYAISFVRHLRSHLDLSRKPSVRASIGLYERPQSYALLDSRKQVTMQDIERSLVSVLAHRIALKPSVKYLKTPEEFTKEAFREFSHSHSIEEMGDEQEGDVP